MIQRLTNHGFKDQMRTIKLSGLDLITSDDVNGVGKSAVLEAFKLALMGEVPGRAKNLDDILQFTSLDEIKVEFFADSRQGPVTVERKFLCDAPSGEKRPVQINQIPRKYEEGSSWIREHIGAVSLSFDPFEFLNLSDRKKRQWIIAHSPESMEMSQRGLYLLLLAKMVEKYLGWGIVHSLLVSLGVASLDEISGIRQEDGFPELQDRLLDIFHRQDPSRSELTRKTLTRAFRFWSPSESAEPNSNAILKYLKTEVLRLKNLIREQTAAFSLIKPASKKESADGFHKIPGCREEIAGLTGTIEEIERQLQGMRTQLAEKVKKEERIRFLKENISRLAGKLNGEMHEALRTMRDQWVNKCVDTKQLEKKRNCLNRNHMLWSSGLNEQESALRRLSEELKIKRGKHEKLGSSHFACPVARQIRCDTDMNPYQEVLGKEIQTLTRQELEARESVEAAKQKVEACKRQIDGLDAELNEVLFSNGQAQREIDLLEEQIHADERETAKARGMLKAYQDEWSLLEADAKRTLCKDSEMEALENEKRILISQKEKIQKTLEESLCQQGKAEALSDLDRKRKRCKQEFAIVRQMAELLEGIQEEMASRIAGALEMEVNETLKLIDSRYDFTLNLRGKQFEMGWNRDGKIIPFNTINSAHFIIFFIPLLAALITRMARIRENSGLPTLKALCIEAESLTPGNLTALLKGLAAMREQGALDNVLVAHYHSFRDPEKLSGFQEHILEQNESPVRA